MFFTLNLLSDREPDCLTFSSEVRVLLSSLEGKSLGCRSLDQARQELGQPIDRVRSDGALNRPCPVHGDQFVRTWLCLAQRGDGPVDDRMGRARARRLLFGSDDACLFAGGTQRFWFTGQLTGNNGYGRRSALFRIGKRRLCHGFACRFFRPPAEGRVGNGMLFTDCCYPRTPRGLRNSGPSC